MADYVSKTTAKSGKKASQIIMPWQQLLCVLMWTGPQAGVCAQSSGMEGTEMVSMHWRPREALIVPAHSPSAQGSRGRCEEAGRVLLPESQHNGTSVRQLHTVYVQDQSSSLQHCRRIEENSPQPQHNRVSHTVLLYCITSLTPLTPCDTANSM